MLHKLDISRPQLKFIRLGSSISRPAAASSVCYFAFRHVVQEAKLGLDETRPHRPVRPHLCECQFYIWRVNHVV